MKLNKLTLEEEVNCTVFNTKYNTLQIDFTYIEESFCIYIYMN